MKIGINTSLKENEYNELNGTLSNADKQNTSRKSLFSALICYVSHSALSQPQLFQTGDQT
jgi:hypothetical protein